jgi:hypothetical protein
MADDNEDENSVNSACVFVFILGSFDDVSIVRLVNNELRIRKESNYNLIRNTIAAFSLERLRKTTKVLCQDSPSHDRVVNLAYLARRMNAMLSPFFIQILNFSLFNNS